MWQAKTEMIPHRGGQAQRSTIVGEHGALSVGDVVRLWRESADFRKYFNGILKDSLFKAFRWEMPGVRRSTMGQVFEFVLLDEPGLDDVGDARSFGDEFEAKVEGSVLVFGNLSGDSLLVVPRPMGLPARAYAHLGNFVRFADVSQQDELWMTVGEQMELRVGEKTVWLSTAGMGVPWLHVRLDSRPKYYGFRGYAELS